MVDSTRAWKWWGPCAAVLMAASSAAGCVETCSDLDCGLPSYSGTGTFQVTTSDAESSADCTDLVQVTANVDRPPGTVELRFFHPRFNVGATFEGVLTCKPDPSAVVEEVFTASSYDSSGSFVMAGWLQGRFDGVEMKGEGAVTEAVGDDRTTKTYLRFSLQRAQ